MHSSEYSALAAQNDRRAVSRIASHQQIRATRGSGYRKESRTNGVSLLRSHSDSLAENRTEDNAVAMIKAHETIPVAVDPCGIKLMNEIDACGSDRLGHGVRSSMTPGGAS